MAEAFPVFRLAMVEMGKPIMDLRYLLNASGE
jgi:hypothetical protein